MFEAILVIVHTGELCETFLEACTDFLHTALLERFDTVEKLFYVVDVESELFRQCFAFLESECLQGFDGPLHGVGYDVPFFVRKLFGGSGLREFGQTRQDAPQICPDRSSESVDLCAHRLNLLHIVGNGGGIDCGTGTLACFFAPNSEIHLTAKEFGGDQFAECHFFLPVSCGNAGVEIEVLTVQRFNFDVDFLSIVFGFGFTVAGHRVNHALSCEKSICTPTMAEVQTQS